MPPAVCHWLTSEEEPTASVIIWLRPAASKKRVQREQTSARNPESAAPQLLHNLCVLWQTGGGWRTDARRSRSEARFLSAGCSRLMLKIVFRRPAPFWRRSSLSFSPCGRRTTSGCTASARALAFDANWFHALHTPPAADRSPAPRVNTTPPSWFQLYCRFLFCARVRLIAVSLAICALSCWRLRIRGSVYTWRSCAFFTEVVLNLDGGNQPSCSRSGGYRLFRL